LDDRDREIGCLVFPAGSYQLVLGGWFLSARFYQLVFISWFYQLVLSRRQLRVRPWIVSNDS
jgi:hypothetical protein